LENTMTSPILLTGGTGTLGRHVLPLLRNAGRDVRVLSRSSHPSEDGVEFVTGDLLKGDGESEAEREGKAIDSAVDGVETVPLGYFKAKLGAEQAVADSGLPWTTLRAAQFHDLILTVAEKMAKLPVIPVPGGLRVQPVDAGEVAARLVELTLDKPAGLVPDLAGPKVYDPAEVIRSYLRASGKKRPMMRLRMPGKAGRVYRAGGNLSREGADFGTRTWEDFLAERLR
jgi:uncharacterized protein YbjT (DUF2867 family)